ncbi:thioesterase family protein [Bradyrhizobium sp. CIAT3101]|uniref:acyl-CoA thioesterase n=1 Tax=Bradyrhizobium sp. CIAT3101 TaxID=439387 RepID=UPI0024B07A54|nr:thioesterase family protein [Bradyrhizobium sp. CIAT3101]WFU80530.1 thioesterase family protein [Bradyrhizobium sp. CIAT3101]
MAWVKTWEGVVDKDWLDKLDHVNFLTYQRIADLASMEVWRRAKHDFAPGSDLQFVLTETNVRYVRELRLGVTVAIYTTLIASDTKRFHLFHRIESAGDLACTVETLNLCFDPTSRRVAMFTAPISGYFAAWGSPPADAQPRLSITRRPFRR